jgi:hypothetical protein
VRGVLLPDESEERLKPEKGRMAALARELAQDPRPFLELSSEERSARIDKIMGVGRGLMSTSEEFGQERLAEIELEERKLAR